MYEHRKFPLLSLPDFARRVVRHGLVAAVVVMGALGIGVLGYHYLGRLGWVDSLLNASMILGGMGPVIDSNIQLSHAAKLFASFYSLFCGIAYLSTSGLLIAPIAHRFFHKLHLENDDQ